MDVLVPSGVCVVLPVMIVWLVARAKQNETNRKAEVMLKAIESGATVDPNLLGKEQTKVKTIKQELLEKLTGACVTTFMGIAFLSLSYLDKSLYFLRFSPIAGAVLLAVGLGLFISFFVGRKMLSKEIEAEENALKE